MNLILEPYVDLKKLEIHFLALKRLISSDFLGSEHLRNYDEEDINNLLQL